MCIRVNDVYVMLLHKRQYTSLSVLVVSISLSLAAKRRESVNVINFDKTSNLLEKLENSWDLHLVFVDRQKISIGSPNAQDRDWMSLVCNVVWSQVLVLFKERANQAKICLPLSAKKLDNFFFGQVSEVAWIKSALVAVLSWELLVLCWLSERSLTCHL